MDCCHFIFKNIIHLNNLKHFRHFFIQIDIILNPAKGGIHFRHLLFTGARNG